MPLAAEGMESAGARTEVMGKCREKEDQGPKATGGKDLRLREAGTRVVCGTCPLLPPPTTTSTAYPSTT